ncbi:MAG: GNAT family N-acetyltransferase [Kiritimatiellia bacterium]
MIKIRKVKTLGDINATAALAREIWTQHYVPIIGKKQTDYMLANFQSTKAIARQIAEGYLYYLVTNNCRKAGYFAIVPDRKKRTALLSKIYVRQALRGRGLGKDILKFAEKYCLKKKAKMLWLTVNRNNKDSIAFYLRAGFKKSGKIVTDIGDGFIMDDYKMVKRLDYG